MGIFRYCYYFHISNSVYRSEDMSLYQLTVPKDDAWEIMNQLGNLNLAHLVDLNKGE